jgi:CheY-like chemotaxis protein
VRLQVGIAAARAKDLPTARRLLRQAVADDPKSDQGLVWLAGVSESMTEAVAHLKRALEINPNNAAAKKGLDYYHAKLNGLPAKEAGPPSEQLPAMARTSGPFASLMQPSGKMPLPGPSIQTPPPGEWASDDRPPAVLVVEPSRTLRKIIALTLADDGLTMTEAEDGLDAVERIKQDGPPAVIVTAAELPGIDGYEFCKLIRQHPETAPIPVVLLTARDGLADRLRVRRAEADAHLPKPLRPAALKAVVAGFRQPEPAAP